MEKRRRARINESLDELKQLITEATKKDRSYYAKLEKADILQLTVQYLRSLKNQAISPSESTDSMACYRAGFNECTNEVLRYLSSINTLDVHAKSKILSHLSSCIKPVGHPWPPYRLPTPQYHVLPGQLMSGKIATVVLTGSPPNGQPLFKSNSFQIVPGPPPNQPLWRPW
ncbi:Transcription factor HES-4-A [Exaiptasia diaphana]|nr:Transcription factor HES-4-A [Exaiptasia diaphana]